MIMDGTKYRQDAKKWVDYGKIEEIIQILWFKLWLLDSKKYSNLGAKRSLLCWLFGSHLTREEGNNNKAIVAWTTYAIGWGGGRQ